MPRSARARRGSARRAPRTRPARRGPPDRSPRDLLTARARRGSRTLFDSASARRLDSPGFDGTRRRYVKQFGLGCPSTQTLPNCGRCARGSTPRVSGTELPRSGRRIEGGGMRSKRRTAGIALAACVVLALVLATWATGASQSSAQAPVGSGTASAKKSVCGKGTGKKATGRPIKLGGINMLIPGVDFTTISKVAAAYFQCVNDNGGINGRPIQYIQYTEQLNPAQEAALARKLIQSDKVVGIVGNTSFAECGTNWKYYQSKGFVVIGAGVQAECFGTPSFAMSNMGPRYSNI